MTTVAYRDGVVASDSQITAGDIRRGFARKIGRLGDTLAAFVGNIVVGQRWLAWVEAGMEGEAPDMEGATGVLLPPNGDILLYHDEGVEVRRAPYFAIGSGGDIALGALAMGATPREAVKVAKQFDIYTGGPVRSLSRD